MVVTGCHPGKRRMKCLDFGKQAATFFDMNRNEAIRLVNVSEKCPKGEGCAKAWFATRKRRGFIQRPGSGGQLHRP